MSKKDSSWKNVENWAKGKEKLKNAILQHPEESGNASDSVYNFMKSSKTENVNQAKTILNFEQYKKLGK